MRFALINPNWTFDRSIYFGCREPHLPHVTESIDRYVRAKRMAELKMWPAQPRVRARVRTRRQHAPLLRDVLQGVHQHKLRRTLR